ncbi:hypothetical protein QTP88_017425 [Uroleucon formosanum]
MASSSSHVVLRTHDEVYLVGNVNNQIVGSKLPSIKQVLSVLFYNLRHVKLNLRESARLVFKETVLFWQKARIPVRDEQHCILKLEKLYQNLRELQKSAKRASEKNTKNVNEFKEKLNDLFDVSHSNSLNMMKIEEDKNFLLMQRQKGRPGCMLGTDTNLAKKEHRAFVNLHKSEQRRKKAKIEIEQIDHTVQIDSNTDGSSTEEEVDIEEDDITPSPSCSKKQRGSRDFMTPKLLAALDKCKLSDRDAVHIIISTADALGNDVSKLIINRSTIQRDRIRFRENKTIELQKKFNLLEKESLVLHWDGKLLPDITYGKSKADRLPVIVSFEGITQLLGVPKLKSGTGEQQANAIFDIINDWGVTNKVQALCCDTMASNTGRLNGACIILEQLIGRNLLYLPCRRHIYELVLRSVFEIKLKINTIGPDVPIFKKFQQAWPEIDLKKYEIGINDAVVKSTVETNKSQIIDFCLQNFKKKQCRDDYKELLELTVIFLGENPLNGIFFHYPGAFHHARWMSKAIYSFKIYMFRKQFKLNVREENQWRTGTLRTRDALYVRGLNYW